MVVCPPQYSVSFTLVKMPNGMPGSGNSTGVRKPVIVICGGAEPIGGGVMKKPNGLSTPK